MLRSGATRPGDDVPSERMSYIPELVASLGQRLDELSTEIATLERAKLALDRKTPTAPSTAVTTTNGRKSRQRTPPTRAAASGGVAARAPTTQDASKPSARTPRQRPTAARRRSGAAARLDAGTLEQVLADTPAGLSAGALAERVGAGYARVLALLRQLETAGQVRRTGTRRSTLWHLVTDEERITQRAAELENRARAPRGRKARAS